MGNTKTLIISLVLTAFAILLMMTYIQKKEAELEKDLGVYMEVLVASKDIEQYKAVEENLVEKIKIPKKFLQPNYIGDVKDVRDTVAAIPIAKGEVISTNKLMFLGGKTGLAPMISKGKRAIAIRASSGNSVSNLIKPGDRIDIMAVQNVPENNQNVNKVTTVLQDVFVLSVGADVYSQIPKFQPSDAGVDFGCIQPKRGDESNSQFNELTIEVTPKEAQKIAALSGAQLYYTLRNTDDRSNEIILPTTDREVLGIDK